jgi:hypothetical protein
LIMTLLKLNLWGGGGEQREQRKSKTERGEVYTTRVQMARGHKNHRVNK